MGGRNWNEIQQFEMVVSSVISPRLTEILHSKLNQGHFITQVRKQQNATNGLFI